MFGISLGVLLLAAAYIVINYYNQRINQLKRQKLGLQVIRYLRLLLEYAPQHRGMVNAILQGDESFRSKIHTITQRIEENINVLLDHVNQFVPWAVHRRVQQIHGYWQDISANYERFSAQDSFTKCWTFLRRRYGCHQ